ncbi:MAG: flavodoxin [Asgard group archaeon]|nr:flavodoxin [Asgard group archaeon]
MKSLVLYYSRTGNTKLIAETIANETKSELIEIKRQKEIKGTGFMLYFMGGFQSMTKQKTKLEEFDFDINDYDLIFIGSPVWAWNINPAIRSLLNEVQLKDKKIALFCCCAGDATKILTALSEKLVGNTILGESQYIEPLKNDTEANVTKAKE